jgi:hypothetical protein
VSSTHIPLHWEGLGRLTVLYLGWLGAVRCGADGCVTSSALILLLCDDDDKVVTGASDGIGREFAIQLARAGFNVLLAARNQAKLDAVVDDIGAPVFCFFLSPHRCLLMQKKSKTFVVYIFIYDISQGVRRHG